MLNTTYCFGCFIKVIKWFRLPKINAIWRSSYRGSRNSTRLSISRYNDMADARHCPRSIKQQLCRYIYGRQTANVRQYDFSHFLPAGSGEGHGQTMILPTACLVEQMPTVCRLLHRNGSLILPVVTVQNLRRLQNRWFLECYLWSFGRWLPNSSWTRKYKAKTVISHLVGQWLDKEKLLLLVLRLKNLFASCRVDQNAEPEPLKQMERGFSNSSYDSCWKGVRFCSTAEALKKSESEYSQQPTKQLLIENVPVCHRWVKPCHCSWPKHSYSKQRHSDSSDVESLRYRTRICLKKLTKASGSW